MEANSDTQGKVPIHYNACIVWFSIFWLHAELKMEHNYEVCAFLNDIDRKGLIQLGGALGLNFPKLRGMNLLPGDMVAAWLRREDNVLESGKPTWVNLVRALEKIGQIGIAKDIKQEKYLDQNAPKHIKQEKHLDQNAPKHCFNNLHFCLLSLVVAILGLALIYYFFPTIMYRLNLCHSKTLPYGPENFAGRENELGELIKLIDFSSNPNDFRIVNIIGSPGFGKSTLAIHVGHEMVRSGILVLYIDLTDFPSYQPVKQVLADKILEGAEISSQFAVKFNRLLRWARESYQNKLLILDNCDEVLRDQNQMNEFQIALQKLVEASKDLKILITSRREIVIDPYSKFYSISELSLEASCELLQYREQNGIKLTPDQRKQIANLTGNVPLALHIMKSLLDRIGAPRPDELIKELAEEPVETLSPEDFQSNKQVKATFDLSYRYLDPESQIIGSQLTLFPGSFTEEAAVSIFSKPGNVDHESLQNLVRNSILSYDCHKKRYQYHQLIKQYLLYIQTEIPELQGNSSTKYFPFYCIYYSWLLTRAHAKFQTKFEVSVAIINSDRHNFHHLLRALKTMQLPAAVDEFLDTAIAISNSFDIGLLNVRFPINDIHMALKNALIQFDFIIDNELYKEQLEIIFFNYVRIMRLVSNCAGNIEARANVLAQRQNRIEANKHHMNSDVYIDFFQQLGSYYSQLNHTQKAEECHSKILVHTYAHLCLEMLDECTLINVGISNHRLGEYSIAADLLELGLALLEKGSNFMDRARILAYLISSYSELNEHEKISLNVNKLRALHRDIMNLKPPVLFSHYKTVSMILKIYKEQEFVPETRELFNKIVNFVEKETQSKNVLVSVRFAPNQYAVTFLDIYNLLTELYNTEQYAEVIKIATFMIEEMKKVETAHPQACILPKILKLQLLVGKAKVRSKNYSDGLQDIELVLEMILSDSKGVYNDLEDEKRSACWELFPHVVYLEPCYQIKEAIFQHLVNITLSLFSSPRIKLSVLRVEKSLQDWYLTMSSSSVQNERIKLSHAKELASTTGAFKYIIQEAIPLQELRQLLKSVALTSDIITLKMCVFSLQIIFNDFFCFLLDIFVVWLKLTCVYLLYHLIRYHHLIMHAYFIADLLFCFEVVFDLFNVCLLFLKQPKKIGFVVYYQLLWEVRLMRDPRFKYGKDYMPHVYIIIDNNY